MDGTRTRRDRGIALPALLLLVAGAFVPAAVGPAPAVAQAAAPTVTAQPATGVGLDVNWTSVPGAAGYWISATDNADGRVTSASCYACNRVVIPGLALLHFYTVRVLPVTASGAPAGSVGSAVSATYFDLPPIGLSALTVTPTPGDQQLRVRWAYNTLGVAADSVHLELRSVDAVGLSWPVAAVKVYRTIEPSEYVIPVTPGRWIVQAIPQNAAGSGPVTQGPVVDVANTCAGAALCARVSTGGANPVRLIGQGFLHGLPAGNEEAVAALDPQHWRISGRAADTAARRLGVSRTQSLSDLWTWETAGTNGGFARTPWSDWSAWRNFVRSTVNRARAEGWSPDYWDIWNEPNGTCCPRFSPADLGTVTTARWFQAYEEAWRAIKAADPGAGIVGPSTSQLQWSGDHWPDPISEFDLDAFLAYSAQKGLVWDAVTWHENSLQPGSGDISYTILNVERHLTYAREVMARHPGTVKSNRIFVNEYGPAETHLLPGWAVGYVQAFEENGVAAANRTCWIDFECWGGGLDGLFDAGGLPTGLWWAHRLYADLDPGAPMTVQSSASWQFDGLAARDDATSTVRVLLGRHWWCNQAVNAWCGFAMEFPPVTGSVTIDWPYGTAPVDVAVRRIPAGTGALPDPVAVSNGPQVPVGGLLTVPVPAIADGDAISIVATTSGTTPPPTSTPPTSTTPPTTTPPPTTAPPTTTRPGGPPILSNVTGVAGPGRASITLSWNAAIPNGAPVLDYTATCRAIGAQPKSVTVNGSTLSATLTNLTWWRVYNCAATARNQFGTSAEVNAVPAGLRPSF